MLRKRLAQAVVLYSALQCSTAMALGVGEIAPESALNQPFRAFIPLKDVGDLDADQIKASLASYEDFDRAGIEYTGFLSKLKFTVDIVADGTSGIVVTSDRQVTEPYLDFILEIRWPNGRVLREYTVLLDLPVFADGPARTVTAAEVSGGGKPASPAPAGEPGGARGPVTTSAPTAVGDGAGQPRPAQHQTDLPPADQANEYRVQHKDTMWVLASKFRPSQSVSTEQTMLAILEKNPEAFIGKNVNQLKSGYVLRLPSEAEAAAVEQQAAVAEISKQNKIWRGQSAAPQKAGPASQSQGMAPQVNATASATGDSAPEGALDGGKFSVGSAGEGADSGSGDGELETRLREQEEVLEKAKLENEAMQGRVAEMEKQIATLERLISLKNNELAALQAKAAGGELDGVPAEGIDALAATEEETDEAAAAVAAQQGGEGGEESLPTSMDETQADAPGAEETAKPEVAAAPAPEPKKPESTAAEKPAADTGVATTAWYENDLLRYIGAGILLLLLVLLGLRRRAQSAEQANESLANFDTYEAPIPAVAEEANPEEQAFEETAELEGDEAEGTVSQFDFSALDEDEVEAANEAEEPVLEAEPEVLVEAQTSDVVGEADIYIAYGNYEQAQSMLRNAIAKDPENVELRLKLIDTYLDTRDQENFKTAFDELKALGDDAAVGQVKESMSAIEGVSDWLSEDSQWDTQDDSDFASLDELDDQLSELDESLDTALGDLEEEDTGLELQSAEVSAEEPTLKESDVSAFSFDDLALEEEGEKESELSLAELEDEDVDSAQEDEDDEFDLGASGLGDLEIGADSDADSSVGEAKELSLDDLDADLAAFDELELDAPAAEAEEEADDLDLEALLGEAGLGESAEADSAEEKSELALDDLDLDLGAMAEEAELAAEPSDSEELDAFNLDDLDVELASLDASGLDASDAGLAVDEEEEEAPSLVAEPLLENEDTTEEADELDALLGVADADADGELNTIEASEMLAAADGQEASAEPEDAGEFSLEDLVFDEFDATDDASSEGDLSMLSDVDEVATKLDLARAYVDMGDSDGAKEMLEEVVNEGNESQRKDAQQLLDSLG